jgi:3-hydroxybutyryl-CoA dehydrogenase
MSEIGKVGVVGLGTMGAGIAQLCIQAGIPTVAREMTGELCEQARAGIERQLARGVERERLTEGEKDAALACLALTTDLEALSDCDLVIEAIVEDLAVKRSLFAELDGIVGEHCILATNTSALSVGAIASASRRPERVVGLHFFNPAPVLPLVEVVRGQRSSDGAVDTAFAFAQRLGKEPIRAADTPGFVVNRILIPALIDAVRVLDAGTASPEDIDTGMRLGTGWPIGPLALIDLIGVDVTVHAAQAMAQAYDDPRFGPPATLTAMLEAGQLGRKTGRGFYSYDEGG